MQPSFIHKRMRLFNEQMKVTCSSFRFDGMTIKPSGVSFRLVYQSHSKGHWLRSSHNNIFFFSRRLPEREGRHSVPGSENSTAAAGRSTPGGPSASSSTSGSSGRTSQNQPSIPPLAFQFHQHNHQHQHTHTHQHFTPFLHPTATGPPLVRTSEESRSPSNPPARVLIYCSCLLVWQVSW